MPAPSHPRRRPARPIVGIAARDGTRAACASPRVSAVSPRVAAVWLWAVGVWAVTTIAVSAAVPDPGDWSGGHVAWREDPRAPADAPYGVDAPPSRWTTRRSGRRSGSRRRVTVEVVEPMPPGAPPGIERPSPYGPPAASRGSTFDEGMSAAFSPFGDMVARPSSGNALPPFCPVPGPIVGAVPAQPAVVRAAPFADPAFGSIEKSSPLAVVAPQEFAADGAAGPTGPFQPASVRSDTTGTPVVSHRDQPYAVTPEAATPGQPTHGRHRFDLHRPAGCSAGGMPLLVWIHGDSWRDGSKTDCPIVWMADEGYVVASVGYRLSDAAVFPAQLDDCRAAIEQIVRDADVWGIDPTRVAVAGSGGGGHLAALVGLVREPAAAGAAADPATAPPRVAAVCAVGAPANLTTLGSEHDRAGSSASRLVGGPLPEFREKAQRASPMSHVSADDPPVLLVHGAADATVRPRQATEFDAALRAAGVDSTLVILPGVGHNPPLGRGTPAGQSLLMFLDRTLGPGVRTDPAAADAPPVPRP